MIRPPLLQRPLSCPKSAGWSRPHPRCRPETRMCSSGRIPVFRLDPDSPYCRKITFNFPSGRNSTILRRYLPDNNERRFRSACSPLGVDTSSSSSSESCDPDTDTVLLGMLRAYPGSPCARSDRGFFRRRCDRRSSSTSMALTV